MQVLVFEKEMNVVRFYRNTKKFDKDQVTYTYDNIKRVTERDNFYEIIDNDNNLVGIIPANKTNLIKE